MRTRAAVLAAPLLAAALAGCGEKTVDAREAETAVAEYLDRTTGAKVTVTCPDDMRPDKGRRYVCRSKGAGQRGTVTIQFTGEGGHLRIADTSISLEP